MLAGQEGISYWYDYFYAQSSGQTDDRLLLLQQGTSDSRTVSQSSQASKFLSFFGHADYSFDNRYIADVTVRNDASSRFGANKRNATFWSVGARWNLSREPFMKNVKWLTNATIKASYGTQGRQRLGYWTAFQQGSHVGTAGPAELWLQRPFLQCRRFGN